LVLAVLAQLAGRASAQESTLSVEVPILVVEEDSGFTDEPESDLTQMVLSAAKRVQTVLENPSIVTVVTRNQIQVRGYQSMSDVLDDVPGFEGYRPAFYFDTPDAFARGNGRTILVLWNGVPLNSPQTNQRPLGPYLMMDPIDRVEVLSGPGGVLWGANALLGITSVTTLRQPRMPAKTEVAASVGSGPYATGLYRASATVADAFFHDGVRVYANLGLVTSRGPVLDPTYDIQIAPFTAPDTDGTVQLGASTGRTVNQRDLWMPLTLAVDAGPWKLDVLYPILSEDYREFNDSGGRTDQIQVGASGLLEGTSSQRAENVTMASLGYEKKLSGSARVFAKGYWSSFEDRWVTLVKYAPGLLSPNAVVVKENYDGMNDFLHDGAYRAGSTVDVTLDSERSHLIIGGEAYLEGIRGRHQELIGGLTVEAPWVTSYPGKRFVSAIYADERYDVTRGLTLDVGTRGQYAPGSYDPLLLGNAALRWNPYHKINLKLNVAQGFRPPPFALTNGNDDSRSNPYPHQQSNPDLRAERSLSLEGELSAKVLEDAGRVHYAALRLGYQYTRLDDLIVFDAAGVPTNANRRLMNSIEVRADTSFVGGHRFVIGYSFLRGRDEQSGPMRNIPEHRLRMTLEEHVYDHVDVYLGMAVTGATEDLDRLPLASSTSMTATAPPGSVIVDRLPPTGLVNLGVLASGLLDGNFDLAFHVQNAFDAPAYIADPDFERRAAILPMRASGLSATFSATWRM
jgi:outer membrane cobalamin receptor